MMDDRIDSPEEKYMRNSTLIDELEYPVEIENFSRYGKQEGRNQPMDASRIQIDMEYVDKHYAGGKAIEKYQEEIMPTSNLEHVKILNDEDYFASIDTEQKNWYEKHGPEIQSLNSDDTVNCSSCNKQVQIQIGSTNGITRHPLLGVVMCMTCRRFYKDGRGWEKDNDGCDMYCRWCGQGGDLVLCDKCPAAFCKRCIQKNLGREQFDNISNSEEWNCLICIPTQIYKHKALYYSLYRFNIIIESRRSKIKEKRRATSKQKSDILSTKAQHILKSSNNFIEENIGEALKTLSIYQKCLEKERKRWVKHGRTMDVALVTEISKSLRKIYAITKQNMDLLDRAVVQSYINQFPNKSTNIDMEQNFKLYSCVKKQKLKDNKRKLSSRNVLPKKKVSFAPKGFVLEGKPVYAFSEDMNNNVIPESDENSNKMPTKRKPSPDISFQTCMSTIIESDSSDWSDIN